MPNVSNLTRREEIEFSDKFFGEMLSMNYAAFAKKFTSQEEMLNYITNKVNKILEFNIYNEDMKKITKRHPDFNKNIKSMEDANKNLYSLYAGNQYLGYNYSITLNDYNAKHSDTYFNGKELPGKLAFDSFRETYRQAHLRNEFLISYASNPNWEYFEKENFSKKAADDIDAMLDDLKSADKMFRGSSAEYKEIQSEFKNLKKLIAENTKPDQNISDLNRVLNVSYRSILEKVEKYIDKRKNLYDSHSLSGYKGKRVFMMEVIKAKLTGKVNYFNRENRLSRKENKEMYSSQDIKNSNKKLIESFGMQTFSAERYESIISTCRTKDGKPYELDEGIKNTMSNLLDGCYVTFKEADMLRKKLVTMEKAIETGNTDWLESNLLRLNHKDNIKVDLAEGAVFEDDLAFVVAGNSKVDKKIKNYMKERMNSELNQNLVNQSGEVMLMV